MKVTHYKSDGTVVEEEEPDIVLTEEEILSNELQEIDLWFVWYDNQIAQYNRCQRLGIEFDRDINELDNEATQKQLRIREIKEQLKISQTKS